MFFIKDVIFLEAKGLKSKENFIVKHVRYTDLREVLAVTVDGATYFKKDAIKRIANMVEFRGGTWSW